MQPTIIASRNAAGLWLPVSGAPQHWISGQGLSGQTLRGTDQNEYLYGPGDGGLMVGDGGDDTYFVYDGRDHIEEAAGAGIDTVVLHASFYALPAEVENMAVVNDGAQGIGNELPNIIAGGDGRQALDGGAGFDVLYGGAGADRFVFLPGTGRDVVGDFELNADLIVIGAGYAGFTSFAAVQAAMWQSGTDTVVELGGGDAVILANTAMGTLTAAQFALPAPAGDVRLTFADEFIGFMGNATGLGPGGAATWTTTFYLGGRTSSATEEHWYADAGTATPNPFAVEDGVLRITARPTAGLPDGLTYTSGVITSSSSHIQTYGYFEMRAQLPAGAGFWPAFWLLQADHHSPAEIDVMEVLGHEPDRLHAAVHWGTTFETRSSATGSRAGTDLSAGFNTFGMAWRPDVITFYLNGTEYFRAVTPADLHRPMFMIANLAVGGVGSWPGPSDGVSSATMSIDYIRAYQFEEFAGPWRPTNLRSLVLDGAGTKAERLVGGAGPDRITGNRGNDTLTGGQGRDTFVVQAGDGADVIADFQPGVDTLILVGVSAPGITLSARPTGLVVSYNRGRDTVTLQGVTALQDGDLLVGAPALRGTAGHDTLDRAASARAETILAGDGNDRVTGGSAPDWIEGSRGNDTLTGRGGPDIFAFQQWDGDDIITDFTPGVDVIRFRGVSSETVWVNPSMLKDGRSGLEVNYGNQGESIFLLGVSGLSPGDIVFGD